MRELGAWLITRLPKLSLCVVTEFRHCSSVASGGHFYNELTVWSLNANGTYLRNQHMEALSSSPGRATKRHHEIVERLIDGRELIDLDSEE